MPSTDTETLELAAAILTFEVPFSILLILTAELNPVSWLPLPIKNVPLVMLPMALIVPPAVKSPLTAIVLAVIILAVERILVQLFVAVLYW